VIALHSFLDLCPRSKQAITAAVGCNRIFVGQLHEAMSEFDLKELCSPFGEIENARLQRNEHNQSKGFGYVT
jgi:RNA recognition motif-containing protein